MKRRSAIDNLRPWAAWMVRRRMWMLVYVVGLVVGTVIAAAVAAWEVVRQICTVETFREAWRDLRQAAREAAEERAANCRCVDCGGSEPGHSAECEYMAELHGDREQAAREVKPVRSLVIYGPQACGKTRHAEHLAEYFGLTTIVDEWDGRSVTPAVGALILTSVPNRAKHRRAVVDYAVAAAAAGVQS